MKLPSCSGELVAYNPMRNPLVPGPPEIQFTRTAFAAAHVVSDPFADRNPWLDQPSIDWDTTLQIRHWLWDQGLHLAEAMDTAQRGMGLDWTTARELIGRATLEAKAHPLSPRVACGAGTDHAEPGTLGNEDAIVAAYEFQMETIENAGGQVVLMASRALPALGARRETYCRVYGRLLSQATEPVILHWLGDMFDPALNGYWGSRDIRAASKTVLEIMAANAGRVDGIKISLLDRSHEEWLRRRLPAGVCLYTGDDFNYAELIEGDGTFYSHALLGIFAAIAPAASLALEALSRGDNATYHEFLQPTVPLSQEIFKPPTQFYKAGIAFVAWLNGLQPHFVMPAGLQSSREITHYAEVFQLADKARLLVDPYLAESRMKTLLALHGVH